MKNCPSLGKKKNQEFCISAKKSEFFPVMVLENKKTPPGEGEFA